MRNKFFSIFISLALMSNTFALPAISYTMQGKIQAANNYVKIAHDAYYAHNFLKAAEYYEKAYQVNPLKVYRDNANTAYMSLATQLSNDKDYDNALKYANKLLVRNPNDNNVKDLISDIYFTRGTDYFYTGNMEKSKQDVENSLKYAVSKEQTDRAKDALDKIKIALESRNTPIPKYEQDNSVPDLLSAMEQKVYGAPNNTNTLTERISELEKVTFGQSYDSDGFIIRVDRLKKSLLPDATSRPQSGMSYSKPSDDDYIQDIIDQSMGRVTIFGKMPITVYINDSNVKPYKNFYKDAVIEGFKEWEQISEDKIKFKYIPDPAHADIQVVWTENFEDFLWKPELKKDDLSAEKQRMKYRKASAAAQIGSLALMLAGGLVGVPAIGGLGMVGGSAVSPYLQYKSTNSEKLSPDIKINTKITEGLSDPDARLKVKQIAIHQMGHALGIFGHSPDSNDIMYSNFTVIKLSDRDVNTIREIYKSKEPVKQ